MCGAISALLDINDDVQILVGSAILLGRMLEATAGVLKASTVRKTWLTSVILSTKIHDDPVLSGMSNLAKVRTPVSNCGDAVL